MRKKTHTPMRERFAMFYRLLQLVKPRELDARAQAIRDGRLVDMQRPPFRQFNEIVNCHFPLPSREPPFSSLSDYPASPKRKLRCPQTSARHRLSHSRGVLTRRTYE